MWAPDEYVALKRPNSSQRTVAVIRKVKGGLAWIDNMQFCEVGYEQWTPRPKACFITTLTPEIECEIAKGLDVPTRHSVWRHRDGGLYGVETCANVGSDRPAFLPTVIYYRQEHADDLDHVLYARSLARWAAVMTREVG